MTLLNLYLNVKKKNILHTFLFDKIKYNRNDKHRPTVIKKKKKQRYNYHFQKSVKKQPAQLIKRVIFIGKNI